MNLVENTTTYSKPQSILLASAIIFILIGLSSCGSQPEESSNWSHYGGGKKNQHYSSLTEITKNNVSQLSEVWSYQSGDADSFTQIQTNPIVIDTTLITVSPKLKLQALNAKTGELIWSFDPFEIKKDEVKGVGYFSLNVCRGVVHYQDKEKSIIYYAAGSNLYAIEANSGVPYQPFANNGILDLHNDLGKDVSDLYIAMTSPGIIYKDKLIIGTRVSESAEAAPGHVRAYNVHNGALEWIFHTIPKPGQEGYESWEDPEAYKYIGGANAWSGFSMDEDHGLVFVPIGSASYDFYGGNRKGDNLFANSLVSLDANTGKKIWHYQTVHHDLWDRDLPTPPVVAEINKNGKEIPVVIQPTKSGFLYVLNRFSGEPVFEIEEIEVPIEGVLDGEKLSKTQPVALVPKPFARQSFTEEDINSLISKKSQDSIRKVLSKIRSVHIFDPPSKEGTLIWPGYDGGAEWGGASFNPESKMLFINSNEMPWILTMKESQQIESQKETVEKVGSQLYTRNCMVCHGEDKKGSGDFPSLVDIENRISSDSLISLLHAGRGMMPSFNQLNEDEKRSISSYLLKLDDLQDEFKGKSLLSSSYHDVPFVSTGYKKFLSPEGYPAINPPWGTLTAINMNTGEHEWQIPLGETPEFEELGIRTGTENYGGAVVTKSGILFIAATKDSKIRAFDQKNGDLLWEAQLPYPGYATPSVYQIDGKEYLVIACGGGKLGSPSGDRYVAFSL